MAARRLSESPSGDASGSEDSRTLKYHLLGPSLTKAGQDKVDQSKVSEIIYDASKGTKFFKREQIRDRHLTEKIGRILMRKRQLEKQDLTRDLRNADRMIAEFESSRDLTQIIVHVDCDAFYAAVEQLERPELKTLPFAVGSGVLTTCNYVARQFGCRSGMAGFVAKKLCPDLIFIKPNFRKYTAKAQEVREVFAAYDPRFESAGIDEAYLNITDYCAANDIEPAEAVNQMRKQIQEKTCITVSAGIAANTRLAKICSNMNKPNGQYVLPNDRDSILEFMQVLPTRKVNGIGRVLERELLEIGVKTWGDVFEQRQLLYPLFGEKTSTFLLNCYLGLGRTAIHPAEEYERKSVGTESTFSELSDPVKLREKLRWTAKELESDLSRAECKGCTLCLKVKLHTFEVLTRQRVMPRAVQLADEIYNQALPMFHKLQEEYPDLKLRLMGLRCTHLVSTKKPDTMTFLGFKRRKLMTEDDRAHDGAEAKTDQNYADTTSVSHGSRSDGADGGLGLSSITDVDESFGYTLASDEHGRGVCEEKNDWWDCPICLRPQPANEQQVNEHIDSCLSRQAVRDAARDGDEGRASSTLPDNKTPAPLARKKRKIPVADPKQKKLSFG
ncbi:hypothetical protein CDD80_7297 [Ophiocordyceps camponoti-rufipedis]|uniref:DNA polymerase kappa n=1 Tax=Ophiocordyceps camponoti-rufipedis TaxID=2004952 RepID=A0A2C5ZLV5_9HYPO|nr:hypothetical protein CDD80_7297 [Ophiocordyceps camponoti-rufipedis]